MDDRAGRGSQGTDPSAIVTDLGFEWFTARLSADREVSYLLPVGTARNPRMRFYPVSEIQEDPKDEAPGGYLAFGETIEVSADFIRSIMLHLNSGAVSIQGLESRAELFTINSSLDLFISSIALYEVWHKRLLQADHPHHDPLAAAAKSIFAQLDPHVGPPSAAWWPTRIDAIGRLI